MSIIATWYACRQNVEFWKNSDLGFTCGAFNSQCIEFTIWFHKRLHYLHAHGQWSQINNLMELMVAGTEGALKHNIPNFVKIASQHKEERERWWNNETSDFNDRALNCAGGLHKYFVRLLRTVEPLKPLPRRILNIINTNRHAVTNRVLRKHLRRLGYKHSEWESDRIVINENQQQDIDEHKANNNENNDSDSGDSNDDDDSHDSDSSDSDKYDSEGSEIDEMDIARYGLDNVELITTTSRSKRRTLLRLLRENDDNDENGENDQ